MAPAPAASPAPTTPARPTRAPSSSIGGTGGSPGILCTAAASYKKKAGSLTLTKKILSWTPAVEGVDDIEIQNGRLNSLFSSKEGGAKVMIRVGVLPTSAPSAPAPSAAPGTAAPEDFLSFTFTNASSAVSDREQFKREIAQLVSRNRASREEALKGPPLSTGHSKSKENTPGTATPGGEGMDRDKGKSVDPTQDWRVKKRVLQNDPELRQLHKDLVMGKHITEGEFWEGREDLLIAESIAETQRRGRSAQMVDPRPETTSTGDITISVTPQMIHDIFEQYPVVQRAYSENVPPLTDQLFWTRYFRSKLFHRHRSSSRTLGDAVKDDEVFDKYLEDDDDDLEPRNMEVRDVYRLLDLAATEEDHGETGNIRDWTMQAGKQRASLPLMRRFNEHSERLLDSALGKSSGRGIIDGGHAGVRNLTAYESDILLSDLEAASAPDRILLDLPNQERFLQTSAAGGDRAGSGSEDEADGGHAAGRKRKRRTEEEVREVVVEVGREFAEWVEGGKENHGRARLEDFSIDDEKMRETTEELMRNVRVRYDLRHGTKDDALPASVMTALTSLHSATNEFLRHFWSAVLPPRSNDISASASASPQQKAAKAQRMLGFLEKTGERIQAVKELMRKEGGIQVSKGHGGTKGEERIDEAVESVVKAVDKARQYYLKRTTAK